MRYWVIILVVGAALFEAANSQQEVNRRPSRPRSRSLIPEFNFRPTGSRRLSNNRKTEQNLEKANNGTNPTEPRIITKPQPGQEYVSFVQSTDEPETKQKNEILLITDPVIGNEYVSLSAKPTEQRNSVISAKNGEVFYVNFDKATVPSVTDTTYNSAVDDYTTTELPFNEFSTVSYSESRSATEPPVIVNYLPDKNIEILSPHAKPQIPGTAVNELYGKYFDESDLAFGKGVHDDEKRLFPAESRVRSKFEIKEVNGQLYEYEYRYYYDDELTPEYDYDVVGNIPDIPANETSPAVPSEPATPLPPTSSPRFLSESRGTGSLTRSRTRGSDISTPQVEENSIIQQNSRGRTRGHALNRSPDISSNSIPLRSSSRALPNESPDTVINSLDFGNARLPTQTRFPPRGTPVPVNFNNFASEPVTSLPSVLNNFVHQNVQGAGDQSSTLSPATRSLMNLYALSQAAEAEDADSSTVQNGLLEQQTEIPIDYLDGFYDYDYDSSTRNPFVFESTTIREFFQPTTKPTTAATTTTTTTSTTTTTTTEPSTTENSRLGSRNRGGFRNPLSRNRGRLSSRTDTPSGTAETTSTTAAPKVSSSSRRFSNRFSSGSLSRRRENRFKPSSRGEEVSSTTEEGIKTVDITQKTVETSTTEGPRRFSNRRINRPRLSFRPSSSPSESAVTANKAKEEVKETTSAPFRNRFRNRFSRRREQNTENEEKTVSIVEKESSVSNGTETEQDPPLTSDIFSTTTTAATIIRPSRTRGLGGRRGFRRPSRLSTQTETTPDAEPEETESVVDTEVSETIIPETKAVETPINSPPEPSNRRPSRVRTSSRFSNLLRGRGRSRTTEPSTTSTTAQPEEDEIALGRELPTEATLVDVVPLEEPVVEEEEEKVELEPKEKKPTGRRGSIFGRFRNRAASSARAVSTTTKATPTPSSSRRSGISLLGNRRRLPGRRNRNQVEEEEEPTEPEVVDIVEESQPQETVIGNDLEAQGPQVELEAQASEDHEIVVEEQPAVEEPTPEPQEPENSVLVKEKPEKNKRRGLSLLSRLRSRNRPQRE